MIRNPGITTSTPPRSGNDSHEQPGLPASRNWWSSSGIWSKAAAGVLVMLAVIYAGVLLLQTYTGTPSAVPVNSPSQHGSSLSTAPDGLAAYADLLAKFGHKVDRLYARLSAETEYARVATDTLVVASPSSWNESDSAAVRRLVIKGGTAVLAGSFLDTPTIEGLLGLPVTTSATTKTPRSVPRLQLSGYCGSQRYLALPSSPFTAGIREVETVAGSACFTTPGSFSKMLVNSNGILGLWKRVGQGSLVLMASSSPLQNAMISKDDNAAFAVDLAGHPRNTVTFDETVHPITSVKQVGFGAVPLHWKVALGLGLLAALVAIWSVGKRLGPVSPPERALAPARSGYVDAMATNLSRLHSADDAVALLQEEGRNRLRHRFSIPTNAGDSGLFVTARQACVPDYVLEGLYINTHEKGALTAAGKALAWTAGAGVAQDSRENRDKSAQPTEQLGSTVQQKG